jgi:hypothetical protein
VGGVRVIKARAALPLASPATAGVAGVSVMSPAEAKVTCPVLVSGTLALSNGAAVCRDGSWEAGTAASAGCPPRGKGGKTPALPAAGQAAG